MNKEKWGKPVKIEILLCADNIPLEEEWVDCEVYYNYHATDDSFNYEYGSIQAVHRYPPYVDEIFNLCLVLTNGFSFMGKMYNKNKEFPIDLIPYIVTEYASIFTKNRIHIKEVPDKIKSEDDFWIYVEERVDEFCNKE